VPNKILYKIQYFHFVSQKFQLTSTAQTSRQSRIWIFMFVV